MLKPKHRLCAQTSLLGLLLFVTGVPVCSAQVGKLAPAEIERRNAAVGFVQVMDATLQLLRVECGLMMPSESARVDSIARGWYDRNKDDIVAANVWADQYLTYTRTVSTELYQRESNALTTAVASGITSNIKLYFKREQPTGASCTNALRIYSTPQLDLQNAGKNPGYEQFGEFGETLKTVRSASDYAIPAHINTKFPEKLTFRAIASLEAAHAARERGDGVAMRSIYANLAEHRDSTAAQSIGLSYLNGELSPKDNLLAYRWFSAAWGLGNFDGLNAMGVMLRDGMGVETNASIAYGSFLLAAQGARSQSAQDMAKRNTESLQTKISTDEKKALACMTLEAFDAALKKPNHAPPLVIGAGLAQGQRKLGQIIRVLEGVNLAECP